MPFIFVKPVKYMPVFTGFDLEEKNVALRLVINVEEVVHRYPHYLNPRYLTNRVHKAEAYVFVHEVYTPKGGLLRSINKFYELPLASEVKYEGKLSYRGDLVLDVSDLCKDFDIPVGYYIIIELFGLKCYYKSEKQSPETTVKTYSLLPESVEEYYEENTPERLVDVTRRLVNMCKDTLLHHGLISLLYEIGLNDIASDLKVGVLSYAEKDYEKAIKFFRKVAEGFRDYLRGIEKVDNIKNRATLLYDYANSSFHLLSNFGEHYKTYGGPKEAELAKEIALSLARYMAFKIKAGKVTPKQQGGKQ
ncbi:hypothetical protein J4526_01845 [Desulfurococcaceae archaeon MEX13E-LK6-19]|nr:hypothetical protein J4526_01845 [Desulfurococcaceae archaeon MEX13E-LK6-19]